MAISVQCPKCRTLNGLNRKLCSRCNSKIPASGGRYWLRYRDIEGVSKKESLGHVTLKEAREAEMARSFSNRTNRHVNGDLTWRDL